MVSVCCHYKQYLYWVDHSIGDIPRSETVGQRINTFYVLLEIL